MRLIIFHLYTDLINRPRPHAVEARCRELAANNAHMMCITYMSTTPAGLPQGSAPFTPPHAQADMYTVHAHCQKNVVFSHRSRRRKVEWWINMGLGVGWRHRRQIQTPENGLQSRCNHDRPAWWEPCLKRSDWSSYHMIMSLFFLWK